MASVRRPRRFAGDSETYGRDLAGMLECLRRDLARCSPRSGLARTSSPRFSVARLLDRGLRPIDRAFWVVSRIGSRWAVLPLSSSPTISARLCLHCPFHVGAEQFH